jgi:hypothetical protein
VDLDGAKVECSAAEDSFGWIAKGKRGLQLCGERLLLQEGFDVGVTVDNLDIPRQREGNRSDLLVLLCVTTGAPVCVLLPTKATSITSGGSPAACFGSGFRSPIVD